VEPIIRKETVRHRQTSEVGPERRLLRDSKMSEIAATADVRGLRSK